MSGDLGAIAKRIRRLNPSCVCSRGESWLLELSLAGIPQLELFCWSCECIRERNSVSFMKYFKALMMSVRYWLTLEIIVLISLRCLKGAFL